MGACITYTFCPCSINRWFHLDVTKPSAVEPHLFGCTRQESPRSLHAVRFPSFYSISWTSCHALPRVARCGVPSEILSCSIQRGVPVLGNVLRKHGAQIFQSFSFQKAKVTLQHIFLLFKLIYKHVLLAMSPVTPARRTKKCGGIGAFRVAAWASLHFQVSRKTTLKFWKSWNLTSSSTFPFHHGGCALSIVTISLLSTLCTTASHSFRRHMLSCQVQVTTRPREHHTAQIDIHTSNRGKQGQLLISCHLQNDLQLRSQRWECDNLQLFTRNSMDFTDLTKKQDIWIWPLWAENCFLFPTLKASSRSSARHSFGMNISGPLAPAASKAPVFGATCFFRKKTGYDCMTPKYQQHELREIFDQNFKSIHTRCLSVQFQVSSKNETWVSHCGCERTFRQENSDKCQSLV